MLIGFLLPACQPPVDSPVEPGGDRRRPDPVFDLAWQDLRALGPASASRAAAAFAPAPPGPVEGYLPALEGSFDLSRGADLVAAIAALPPERAALGVSGLPVLEVFGEEGYLDGLCERPILNVDVDGHELGIEVPVAVWITTPQRDIQPLRGVCADALAAHPGDLVGALGDGCSDEDEAAFFPEGSACRACLAEDTFPSCVDGGACQAEATRRLFAFDPAGEERREYSMIAAQAPVCAPNLTGTIVLLARDLPEASPLPGFYENGSYDYICQEFWDEAVDGLELYCTGSDAIGHAVGDAPVGRVDHLRPLGGGADLGHVGRVLLARAITADGVTYDDELAFEGTIGGISAPAIVGGWEFPPSEVSPFHAGEPGADATYAREWLASVAMKLSTTRTGVPVYPFDHNRCAEWGPTEADGSSSCEVMAGWGGFHEDGMILVWGTDWQCSGCGYYAYPLTTLISTGLPDPRIPGGVVIDVRAADTLDDLEPGGCAWPERFTPDRIRLYDNNPYQTDTPYSTFDGETFRFERDPSIRLALATNQARGFCPSAAATAR